MNASNVPNRTIFCHDNLEVMRGINDQCIDLIYLDPPFNKNKKFTAPLGANAEGASFRDIFRKEDVKDEWLQTIKEDQPALCQYLEGIKGVGKPYNFAYLAYMAIRFIECHRILKPTGSIYLHCDPTMSHYLKTMMDCIFGEGNFRNEIIWHYRRWTGKAKRFQRLHDVILFYTKSADYTFNPLYTEYTAGSKERKEQGVLHRFKKGQDPHLVSVGTIDKKGVPENDVWHIPFVAPSARERVDYPTQKPLQLLRRIIEASSNPGDMVLDPFCGCATTCVAAEMLEKPRQWVGIDISVEAFELVGERLKKEIDKPFNLKTDPPARTDQDADRREMARRPVRRPARPVCRHRPVAHRRRPARLQHLGRRVRARGWREELVF